LRLNITGIDIIAVDAAVTWRKGNFIICEVNAQPQLGVSHMSIYGSILMQKLKSKPSIKLVVSLGTQSDTDIFDPIYDSLTIRTSLQTILTNGSPVQYFDELEISDDVSNEDRQKIELMLVSVQPELGSAVI
jgi:hypothetical protein